VLEGSVQVAGDRLRITVQLINVKDDYHLWSEQYDRKLEDVLTIQDEISLAIANKLKVKLLEKEKAKLTKRYTGSQEAYNSYLKGISLSYSHTEKGYKKSIEYFKDAIDLDQSYALAYVGLANCYKELARLSYISPIDGYTKAKETAWKAIELDETLGEAYAILAHIRFIYDWDIYGPERDFQRAIELSPNSVDAYRMYIQYLSWIGKHDECVAAAKRVIELDPRTPLSNCLLGIVYFYAERYDESVSHLKNTLTLDPNFPWAHIYLAHNYSLMGAYDEAIAHADKTESINPSFLQFVGVDYAICGRPEKLQKILEQALGPTGESSIDPITVAIIYAGLEEKEKAFQWLEKGYEARSGLMIYLRAYGQTFMRNISSDPRYKELLKKMGFKT
jgi:tetratricopeptide (TPR) repeat protein